MPFIKVSCRMALSGRGTFPPQTIARYREAIGPYLYVKHIKPLRDSGSQAFVQIQLLQSRYLQGEITRAQFIHGLNQQLGASAQGGA